MIIEFEGDCSIEVAYIGTQDQITISRAFNTLKGLVEMIRGCIINAVKSICAQIAAAFQSLADGCRQMADSLSMCNLQPRHSQPP